MNIVTPVPTAIPFVTSNVNTESARRDNQLRETIPQTAGAEQSAAESGLGSESDRVKSAGQPPHPVTYEKPQSQQQQQSANQTDVSKDNADDPSAGKQDAQEQQRQQAEHQEVSDLKERDVEVRNHEQSHSHVGGKHAGAPSYEFEVGPDGNRYAVSGEVSIDISEASTPEETLNKMQQVKAAALAPNEPSAQDLRVASEATQVANRARAEIAQENSADHQQRFNEVFNPSESVDQIGPDLEDIVQSGAVSSTRRSLKEGDAVAEAGGAEVSLESNDNHRQRALESRDPEINRRALRIANYYVQVAQADEPLVKLSA
ncbi:putative metalloprotease CJM1_0395 family protein [Alteromonadaceae bacterium BrNp21-10]|nr:putative metalloprotease CJM1_0395 family protein [Alteromonadaceae bacterium BrNp21-10]